MQDNFAPEQRKKPKVINPLPKEEKTPLPNLDESPDQEPTFKPPEEVAANDGDAGNHTLVPANETTQPINDISGTGELNRPVVHHHQTRHGLLRFLPSNRKQSVIAAAVVVLLLGGSAAAYVLTRPSVRSGTYQSKKGNYVPPPPKVYYSDLSGLKISNPNINKRPVTGVMIENSIFARPQSGLDQAGVVYEAIAEGGITRFLALYQDTQPNYIGPIRSARPYFLKWCMGYNCALAHVGGSPEALNDIKAWHVRNLDEFFNGYAYYRISSRYAPHNMYSSLASLSTVEARHGYGASKFTGFVRKADKPYEKPTKTTPAKERDTRKPATSIHMNISGYYYDVRYAYDKSKNSYKRFEGGQPHMSLLKNGKQVQLEPKVVIALIMKTGLEADHYHSYYDNVGSGQAYIFQDGTVVHATWTKSSSTGALTFTDLNGHPLALNRGQTWLTALDSADQLTYN